MNAATSPTARVCRGCPSTNARKDLAGYCPPCFDTRDRFIASALAGSMSAGELVLEGLEENEDPAEAHASDAIDTADAIMSQRRIAPEDLDGPSSTEELEA